MKLRVMIKSYNYIEEGEINAPIFKFVTCDIEVPKDKESYFNSFVEKDSGVSASIIGTEVIGDTNKEHTK